MLPEITTPIYELIQPSNGKPLKFKPFLVKQEKLLLMATRLGDERELINTTMEIIKSQLVDKIDLSILPIFDIEYLFLMMRGKSIGETIEQEFICNNKISDDITCGTAINVSLSVNDVSLKNMDNLKNNKIMLTETMGVLMKAPPYKILGEITEDSSDEDASITFLMECMDVIFDKDQMYPVKDNTKKELTEFIESLTKQQFDKLQVFADNLPYLTIEKTIKCPKCSFDHGIKIKEPMDFF